MCCVEEYLIRISKFFLYDCTLSSTLNSWFIKYWTEEVYYTFYSKYEAHGGAVG